MPNTRIGTAQVVSVPPDQQVDLTAPVYTTEAGVPVDQRQLTPEQRDTLSYLRETMPTPVDPVVLLDVYRSEMSPPWMRRPRSETTFTTSSGTATVQRTTRMLPITTRLNLIARFRQCEITLDQLIDLVVQASV